MYKIPYFTEQNEEEVLRFMEQYPLATLIGSEAGKSVATQVPLLMRRNTDQSLSLRGHMMRHTDHHLVFENNPDVLALFAGPNCYVSASWYEERGSGSTWNYVTVHVRGTLRFTDESQTIQLLADLTRKFEEEQERPQMLEDLSGQYVTNAIKAIAGFEIEVKEIYPVFKLSQNQNEQSHKNIIDQLQKRARYGDREIAQMMEARRRK